MKDARVALANLDRAELALIEAQEFVNNIKAKNLVVLRSMGEGMKTPELVDNLKFILPAVQLEWIHKSVIEEKKDSSSSVSEQQ